MKITLSSPRPYVCIQCRNHLSRPSRRAFVSASSSNPDDIYDVVTVGGGPVGLALLAAIKSSPTTKHLKTALIESQDLSKSQQWTMPPDKYSNRASSLTPSSVSFLESIGALKHIDQNRVQPYDEMQVYDASNDASIQFDWKAEAERYNAPPRTVATMTENSNLTRALLARISELNVESSLLYGTSVSSIDNGHDDPSGSNLSTWPVISLKSSSSQTPSRIAARLLVGADGFNSPVRSFAGIASHGWDYNRHGVVATLTTKPSSTTSKDDDSFWSEGPRPNRATAYQRFLPALGGPIALLPLPNNRASLVWSTTPGNAAYLKTLSAESFVALVNAAFRLSQVDLKNLFTLQPDTTQNQHEEELLSRLPHTPSPLPFQKMPPLVTTVQENTIASFPLRFRNASSYTAPHVALAGDAAHTIHPLAGQGLNLGLGDAEALGKTIEYAVTHGMDLGDLRTLERYAGERFGRGLVMGGGVDAIGRMYEMGATEGILGSAVSTARGLGMKIVGSEVAERLGVKGWVMRMAKG